MSVVSSSTVLKPMSMATTNCCLTSLPSLFTTTSSKPCSSPSLSLPFKPFKSHLCCSSYSSLFKKKQEPVLRAFVVASMQDEPNPVLVEDQEEEGGFSWGGGASDGEEVVENVILSGEIESDVPNEEAKVYVGNLPYDVDSEMLADLFKEAGIVEIAEVIYNRETEQSRGFGFVTMRTVEEAEKAVEMFHRFDVGGRLLTVNKAAPRGSRPERPPRSVETTSRIYVGNLPWSIDDSRLEQVFSEYGKVVSARVVSDRESGRSRGFGFVVMSSESETNDAIANLDGQTLDGRLIRVNVAEDKPRRF